jgi:hypothetical protein
MPQLFWSVDEGKDQPAYAQGNSSGAKDAAARAPLDVPPELRADLEVPAAADVASADDSALPEKYRQAVAGKAVSLDARVYNVDAASLFSAVVDAMTALNLPVDSVDSPSGIVTSDWIRRGANTPNAFAGIFGGASSDITKHRFVVRVFRLKMDAQTKSKLEIRVLGQAFVNGHWVNRPFKANISKDLFSSVEEQLGRMQQDNPAQAESTSAENPAAPVKASE